MKKIPSLWVASALLACAGAALAQAPGNAASAPQNVLQLSASGMAEGVQDVLLLTLSATREGADAAQVQAQLRQVVDAALAEAKRAAQAEQMEVRSGSFGIYPRHNKDGKISGWQGRAELVLHGRDFPRISTTAGKIQGMAIDQIGFDLARETRAKLEAEAQTRAIEQFKQRAGEMARSFGFASYTLREVEVSSGGDQVPRPRMAAMNAKSSVASYGGEAAVPVEAGKTVVTVQVSGSVQMR